MRFRIKRRHLPGLAAATMVAISSLTAIPALAEYPEKPVTMIIGFKAGGGTDLTGRALAGALSKQMGQPVAVVNQPGAASMIAAKTVADSVPDGYTIWYGSLGTMILKQELGQFNLNPIENFEQTGTVSRLVPSIAVVKNSKYETIQDLIADAKANPGSLRWGHGGAGSAFMASGVGFNQANDLDVVAVPFNGSAKSRAGLIAGDIDYAIQNMNSEMKFGDKIRILGVLRSNKAELIDQNVPAMGELGVDFIAIDSPVGVLLPKETPADVVEKMSAAVATAAEDADYQATLEKLKFPLAVVPQSEGVAQASNIQENIRKILPGLK